MLRSLYSGVSGLKNHQTKMDVIGNNIANVNTAGFKSSRVVFRDVYYQTITPSSAPSTPKFGTNPVQIGCGSSIASIDMLTNRSGYQTTDMATDLYIAGDGYFKVQDAAGDVNYTRVGNFKFDSVGNLVDSNGYSVCGYPMLASDKTKVDTNSANIAPIKVTLSSYSDITIGLDGKINAYNTTTKEIETLGQIVLAKFNNASALTQVGSSYLKPTNNSGTATFVAPGSSSTGSLINSGLEMSNVDLSKEFTDMIVAQRGFQANSRVITTSDEILQELINLKR